MWISAREAAVLLSATLPVREHARLVLRAGLAGEPIRTRSALLYDAEAVRALAERPRVTGDELEAFPTGLFVARLSRDTRVDVRAPWTETSDAVSIRPAMPTLTAALTGVRMQVWGLPWVATLCGYVVFCAEARGFLAAKPGSVRFDLHEPGEWAAALAGRLLATRPGRPWSLLEPGRAGLSARGER
jgi:hypothetical protein